VFLFYDFETQQNIHIKGDNKTRVSNLYVVQQVCTYCLDDNDDVTKLCQYYGTREYVFDRRFCKATH